MHTQVIPTDGQRPSRERRPPETFNPRAETTFSRTKRKEREDGDKATKEGTDKGKGPADSAGQAPGRRRKKTSGGDKLPTDGVLGAQKTQAMWNNVAKSNGSVLAVDVPDPEQPTVVQVAQQRIANRTAYCCLRLCNPPHNDPVGMTMNGNAKVPDDLHNPNAFFHVQCKEKAKQIQAEKKAAQAAAEKAAAEEAAAKQAAAARTIQCCFRMKVARARVRQRLYDKQRKLDEDQAKAHSAATKIQCCFGMHKARTALAKLAEKKADEARKAAEEAKKAEKAANKAAAKKPLITSGNGKFARAGAASSSKEGGGSNTTTGKPRERGEEDDRGSKGTGTRGPYSVARRSDLQGPLAALQLVRQRGNKL